MSDAPTPHERRAIKLCADYADQTVSSQYADKLDRAARTAKRYLARVAPVVNAPGVNKRAASSLATDGEPERSPISSSIRPPL